MCDVRKLWARSDSYRLMSLFLALPTEEIASSVADGSLEASVRDLLAAGGFSLEQREAVMGRRSLTMRQEPEMTVSTHSGRDGNLDELLFELRRDYTALFTNPEHARVQVYEACFKQSDDFDSSQLAFVSPTALDAEREYRASGFERCAQRNESPDHMGVETEYLAHLYAALADAAAVNDPSAGQVLAVIEAFDRKHFLKWGEAFFEQVVCNARSETYRLIGRLGMLMARSECELVQERGLSR